MMDFYEILMKRIFDFHHYPVAVGSNELVLMMKTDFMTTNGCYELI